jgi:FkbM family methyltransferase
MLLYKLYIFFFPIGFDKEDIKIIENAINLKKKIIVFDVGCYLGQFSINISRIFRKKNITFHLFDPINIINIKKNKNHFFFYNNVAISNKNDIQNFFINSFFPSSGSSLLSITKNDFFFNFSRKFLCLNFFSKYQKKKTFTKTLDSYVTKKKIKEINILKIDTEGCEYLVLQGAKKTLLKTNIIFIEILDKKKNFFLKEKKIIKILEKNNFQLLKRKRLWSVSIFSSLKCYDYFFLKNV